MKAKLIVLILIGVLIVIQFFRIDKTNPPVDIQKDYLTVAQVPMEIGKVFKTSCYDCHSNETVYPWYSNIAPVSWMLKNHINEGREHFNFSTWADYPAKKKWKVLNECSEMIEEGEMPMWSYALVHRDAKLSEDVKALLMEWLDKGAEKGEHE